MGESERTDRVLFYLENQIDCEGFRRLFENNGFPVTLCFADPEADFDDYGAVVHLAKTDEGLIELLGGRHALVPDEEWILVSGDAYDLHCTVELIRSASPRLRTFVRSLWSKFSIP